jgi:hypothetical protein
MAPTWTGSREVLIAQLRDFGGGGGGTTSWPPSWGRKVKGMPKMFTCSGGKRPVDGSSSYDVRRSPRPRPAWVKNDHLGFEIAYVFDGVVRKYRPDFLIRLTTGTMLVLEVKGQDSPQNDAKRAALDEWTRAVSEHGGFGRWVWAVSRVPSDIADIVRAAAK